MAVQRAQATDLSSACSESTQFVATGHAESSRGSVLESTPHTVMDTSEPLEHDLNTVVPEPLDHDQNTVVPMVRNRTGSSSLEAIDSSRGSVFESTSHTVMERNTAEPMEHDQNPVVPTARNRTGSSSIETVDLPETVSNTRATGPSENRAETLGERELLATLADQLGTLVSDDEGMSGQTTTAVTVETFRELDSLAAGFDLPEPPSSAVDPPEQASSATAEASTDENSTAAGPSEDDLLTSYWNTFFQSDSEVDDDDPEQMVRWFDNINMELEQQEARWQHRHSMSHAERMLASRFNDTAYARSRNLYRITPTNLPKEDLDLFKACKAGLDLELTKSVLEKGANVNIRLDTSSPQGCGLNSGSFKFGDTPLHTLTRDLDLNCDSQGILDHIRLLGEWGAVPDVTNEDGQTPIMLAVIKQCPQTVQLLVNISRDVDCTSHTEQTALHLCFHHFRRSDPSLLAEQNCLQIARSLINAGARMDLTDTVFQTPLIVAIKNKCPQGARFLILQNCDPNFPAGAFQDRTSPVVDAMSPFAICLEVGDWKTLHLLLQAGCRYRSVSWSEFGADARAQVPDLVSRCSRPRSLMESCRLLIRQTLRWNGVVGDKVEKTVKEFPIPQLDKDFILLKDQGLGFCSVS